MYQMLGVFAEFERSIIVERTKAGLARAKAQGKTLGRPEVTPSLIEDMKILRAQGHSLRVIADRLGVALQLHDPFEVSLLRHGLMTSSPDGPSDDEGRLDPALG